MYRSVLCVMSMALVACMSASEPAAAGGDSQPLSSDNSDPALKPLAPTAPQGPGKPDEACLAKVKQCYADGGDDKTCQVIDEKCQPPQPGSCVMKMCHMDKSGEESCVTTDCSDVPAGAPGVPGVPGTGVGGVKGCGEPPAPPTPAETCMKKVQICMSEEDDVEVCKTLLEGCAPGRPKAPAPADASPPS